MHLGKYISNVMEQQGRNKNWVAEKTDIKYKTFVDKLNRDTISGKELLRIAMVLNINLEDLKEIENRKDVCKMNRNEKLFVGGYYDQRIFKGEQFEGKTPFNKNINVYSLEEVLNLGFVQNVTEWYEEREEKSWDEATEQEQINAIIEYTSTDEIAGLVHFNTETESSKYKEDVIKEIEEIENNSEYQGKKQDSEGNFREIYTSRC